MKKIPLARYSKGDNDNFHTKFKTQKKNIT